MSESKHTPGPWTTKGAGIDASMVSSTLASGRRVRFRVAVCKDGDINTVTANARLIAAAPDMLRELQDIVTWAKVERAPLRKQEIDSIEKLIAKATGA